MILRTLIIYLALLLASFSLCSQDLESLAFIYERNGIRITVPEGYKVLKDSEVGSVKGDVVIWKQFEDGKKDVVDMFDCCLESPDKSLWVLFPGIMTPAIKEGRDDRLDHPKRFASMELAKYHNNPDNGPFYVDDYISCLSGKAVRDLTNADIIYYYELPLKDYRLDNPDLTPVLEIRDDYRFWRFYICKAGGYMLKFLVIDRAGLDDMIISHMDEVLSSIWFDPDKVRKVWEIYK